ncbi:MAG: phosphotriesterase [Dehalococcoidia bacterium]
MSTINTVLGPIDSHDLGYTLSHEHVVHTRFARYMPFLYDREATIQKGIMHLTEAKAGGIDALVEHSTIDLGREVEVMKAVSEASGVHVVAATGLWRDIPRFFWDKSIDYIAMFIRHEIEHGLDDSGVKPGVIKMASDEEGVTEIAELALRAAARVTKDTGVPISTHQWAPSKVGGRQVEVLLEEGTPMHLVCIGHSADTADDAYLEELLEAGCYLSMDRYPGNPQRLQWQERNATVKRLVDRGWAPRLMLGHDWTPPPVLTGVEYGLDESPTRYTFLKRIAIPALMADGVSQEQVDLMTIEAPRRFLSGQAPLPRQEAK